LQLIDFIKRYLNIIQIEDSGDPSHQIDTTTRAIDQSEPGVRHQDGQGDSGKTNTRAKIGDLRYFLIKTGGKEQGIGDMSPVDPVDLGGAGPTSRECLGEEPVSVTIEKLELSDGEGPTGPPGGFLPQVFSLHVKRE